MGALEYASAAMKNTFEIVKQAVKRKGRALVYASATPAAALLQTRWYVQMRILCKLENKSHKTLALCTRKNPWCYSGPDCTLTCKHRSRTFRLRVASWH